MSEFTCESIEEFEQHYGREVADRLLTDICESAYSPNSPAAKGVYLDIYRHDAINMTITGHVTHDGIDFFFEIEDGDRNGTEIISFSTSEPEPYEPPKPVTFTMVPMDENLKTTNPAMYQAYLTWTRMEWFTELLRKYSYDRHFQPGVQVENHYKKEAQERGLKIVYSDSDIAEEIQADLKNRNVVSA